MKIRNETGPNPPDIWLQNRRLRKKEKTALERSFLLPQVQLFMNARKKGR